MDFPVQKSTVFYYAFYYPWKYLKCICSYFLSGSHCFIVPIQWNGVMRLGVTAIDMEHKEGVTNWDNLKKETLTFFENARKGFLVFFFCVCGILVKAYMELTIVSWYLIMSGYHRKPARQVNLFIPFIMFSNQHLLFIRVCPWNI